MYFGDDISFTSLMLAKISYNLSWKTLSSPEKREYYHCHSHGKLVFHRKLSWAVGVHKAWFFATLLAIFVRLLGENTYFICATFCSYLLCHPSNIWCCFSTINHMEWEAVRWIEQLNHFLVIRNILNPLFKVQSHQQWDI